MAMIHRPPPLTECPRAPDSLHFAAYWYRIVNIPDFLVCTKCYEDKIVHTQYASHFELFWHTPIPGRKSTCMFNGLTVDRIWNSALQASYGNTHALATFHAHARTQAQLRDCPGTEGAEASECIRWYGIPQIPDFMACEACYSNFICGSTFVTNFTPYPTQQPPGQTWACDIAIPNIKRHLIEDSIRSDWPAFINAASHRLHQRRCDGSEYSLVEINWYQPIGLKHVYICETCYLDDISLTPNMNQFRELRSNWTQQPPKSIKERCTFSKLSVQICNNQLLERNFSLWQNLIGRITDLPNTCGNTLENGTFHTLINPWTHQPTDFSLCEACHTGAIESSGTSQLFRKEVKPGVASCEFGNSNPRIAESVSRFTEILFTRDHSKLIEYAANLQPSQPLVQPQQQQQQQADPSNWQAISAQLAQKHAMKMSMMNMVFAQNTMHNAAMQGIMSQGSSYDKWHDSTYTTAQWNYSQAQNQMFNAMGGPKY